MKDNILKKKDHEKNLSRSDPPLFDSNKAPESFITRKKNSKALAKKRNSLPYNQLSPKPQDLKRLTPESFSTGIDDNFEEYQNNIVCSAESFSPLFSPFVLSPISSPTFTQIETKKSQPNLQNVADSYQSKKVYDEKSSSVHVNRLSLKELKESGLFLSVCFDQIGSRNIQNKIMSSSFHEVLGFLTAIKPFMVRFCCDVFANYVVQRILELSNKFIYIIGESLIGNYSLLSKDTCGCRVVQCIINGCYDLEVKKKIEERTQVRDEKQLLHSINKLGFSENLNESHSDFNFILFNDFKILDKQKQEVEEPPGLNLLKTIFSEVKEDILRNCLDINGNHVIQKLIVTENIEVIENFAVEMKEKYSLLVQDLYGCRVLQKLLEKAGSIIHKLKNLIKDTKPEFLKADFSSPNFKENLLFKNLKINSWQKNMIYEKVGEIESKEIKLLENTITNSLDMILVNIITSLSSFISHQYGNYVVQAAFKYFLLTKSFPNDAEINAYSEYDLVNLKKEKKESYCVIFIKELGNEVSENFIEYSTHKYASNVIETCLYGFRGFYKKKMITFLENNYVLENLIRDPFGNYVIQTGIKSCFDEDIRTGIIRRLKTIIGKTPRKSSEKHILEFITKFYK